jgi:Cof subfamily protein (haloacid dehalogenase superfamily)
VLTRKERSTDRPLPLEPIELIGVDLDGTLLRDDQTVSVEVAQAITDAQDRGVKVVIVTARPWRGTRRIYEALGLNTLVINHNGAVIHDPGSRQLLCDRRMPGSTARTVIQLARHLDADVGVGVEVLDRFFIDRSTRRLQGLPELALTDEAPCPFDTLLQYPVTKVCLVGDSGSLGGLQIALQKIGADDVGIAYSNVKLLQVLAAGVDKGKGLAFAAEHYGVPRERVMAIGDAPNDTPMIRWAGLGLAVSNGWPEVRRAAQFIVASNEEDGVAAAIRAYAAP